MVRPEARIGERSGNMEAERRLPLWTALSALFLDTELEERDLAHIAERIAATGFGVEEAFQVLEREVAPAFYTNLLSVAAEWSFWTPEEVRIVMTNHLRQTAPRRWLARVASRWTRRSYAAHWQIIATMLASSSDS